MAFLALFIPSISMESCESTRKPAVSTNSTGTPPRLVFAEIKSRVVPGVFETIARFSLAKQFNKVDLPTFGAPSITTLKPSLIKAPCSELFMRSEIN